MTALPNNATTIDLLRWVKANPNKPFDPNMVVSATHTSDWQWQAVTAQMEDLRRQGYINRIKQDPGGSTYWTITGRGDGYLGALERAEREGDQGHGGAAAVSTSIAGSAEGGPRRIEGVSPPAIAKAFGAAGIRVGRTTSLTFYVTNPNPTAGLTGVAFVDILPAGLLVSEPNGLVILSGTGTVTVLAVPGSNTITLSGASLAPQQPLQFTVNVDAVGVGTKVNTTSAVSSTEGGGGNTATASIAVVEAAPASDVARLLSLRVTVSGGNSHRFTMASLIAPIFAAVPYHSVVDILQSERPRLFVVDFLGGSRPASTEADLVAGDPNSDIAILGLKSKVPFDLPKNFLPAVDSDTPGEWQSYLAPGSTRPGMLVDGMLRGRASFEGNMWQRLELLSPVSDIEGVDGAPVILGGQLIGMVSRGRSGEPNWFGIPISTRILTDRFPGTFAAKSASQWLDAPTIARFSERLWEILNSADRIREARKGPAISTHDLVLAFAQQERGQLAPLLEQAGLTLDSLIPSGVDNLPEGHPEDLEFDARRKFPPITSHARLALVRARDKAEATGSATIDDSHLLFGLLSLADTDNLLIQGFSRHGITANKVKLPGEAEQIQGPPPQPGYSSDDPTGQDLLGISREVDALASVLASKDVEPPLSLGLFGDWGTGKSFFMRGLEERIRELTDDAKIANGQSQYCQDIVQLSFNAWNYIDKDLWASLASEIFEGLAAALARKRGGDTQAGRALALAAASSSPTVVLEAERLKADAEARLRESEAQLAELQRNQESIQPRLSPRQVLDEAARFAVKDETLRRRAEEAAQQIGVNKSIGAVVDIQQQLLELKTIWTEIAFSIRNNKLGVWVGAFVLALGVGWGSLFLVRQYLPNNLLGAIVPIVAGASSFLAVLLAGSRKILNLVRAVSASKQKLVDQTQQVVKERIESARKRVAGEAEEVRRLTQQLENMRADRRMVDFIRQRYESTDYREHLGTIARVRRDFRHLSALLRDVQSESEKDLKEMKERQERKDKERGAPLFPRIDRIILYIDDLDRCPEKNVFEVLQAVHLLLAFPLFVVVVGVDPRWLLHSVRQHSAGARSDEAGVDEDPHEEALWESTPMSYLEKIFQIPFTLRPLGKAGFGRLIDAFAAPSAKEASAERPAVARPSEFAAITPGSPGSAPEPVVTPADSKTSGGGAIPAPDVLVRATESSTKDQQVQPAQSAPAVVREPIDRYPEHLRIEEWERDYMKALHELIPSPRAGKRFINIYRLLRASVSGQERQRFVGDNGHGEYQCALMLLAILTGYPAEAAEILRVLVEEEHSESWGELLQVFKARAEDNLAEGEFGGQKPAQQGARGSQFKPTEGVIGALPTKASRWADLLKKLARIQDNLSDRPCGSFSRWAPRVARYSFQSGRLLLRQRE